MACVFAGVDRATRQKVQSMDSKLKSSILGLQAQGMKKDAIAKKMKTGAHIIDGINDEATRKNSASAKQAQARQAKRDQAIRNQRRADKKK